jgi:hypothetical protein
MVFYQTPGVYVREVPSGTRPIQAVGTSTAGFVGVMPDRGARVNQLVAVESWTRFREIFANVPEPEATPLALAVRGFFDNGGRRLHVVNLGDPSAPITGPHQGLALFEAVDEIAIVAAPGHTDLASHDLLIQHATKMEDRFAILDGPATVDRVERLTQVAVAPVPTTTRETGGRGRRREEPAEEEAAADTSEAGTEEAEAAEDTTAAAPAPPPPPPGPPGESDGLRPPVSDYAAFYFPQIVVTDPFSRRTVVAAPSGHLAGIYARTDATRGVHKAPANEPIRGALNLTYRVTPEEQGTLNPAGVNCLRYFASGGITVWGARTLDRGPYTYINVRRLVNMLKESIADGTNWCVFEPNDYLLWKRITRDVRAFLLRVWRDGALMGRTPEQAFFVKCDEETNPPEAVDAGEVRCQIGIAPVKPAEFVIFEISHTERGSESGEGE